MSVTFAFGSFWPTRKVPSRLRAVLDPDERVQVVAQASGEMVLAVTRFGLWTLDQAGASRSGWEVVSRASLAQGVLTIVIADVVAVWDDGTSVLRDRPPCSFRLSQTTTLTDAVHQRVRRSVAAAAHLDWPGSGGWVVLRRIPGRDGTAHQFKLDPGTSGEEPGLPGAVAALAADLEAQQQLE